MSVKRDKIIEFCNEYLKVKDFDDGCFNGLQVEGKEDVSKIVTGVSLSRVLIKRALENQADMIMVHHGFFKSDIPNPFCLKGVQKNRVKALLENDISLVGYHLPLDAHPTIGNNISLMKMFGLTKTKPFSVGFIGELEKEMDFEEFKKKVEVQLCTHSFAMAAGRKKVKEVAIVSGGDSPEFEEAFLSGADVFISGDIREDVVRKIEEVGINFINAGHYNTEKDGIKNLGNLVAKKFKIEVEFVDVPNEV
ncbi:MAG: Nif3-like dinuclear metal center hexameric protein [Candidatus Paceibacterota bacterium]